MGGDAITGGVANVALRLALLGKKDGYHPQVIGSEVPIQKIVATTSALGLMRHLPMGNLAGTGVCRYDYAVRVRGACVIL